MDRIMHRIGLHGKSFIPLIMGFGCNVPAIMATRTIESRSCRLITVLLVPFMSCSARLPIYILLTGTFFSAHAGLVMTGLYVLGILVAVVTARLMRRFFYPEDETPFVMELPPYRVPTMRATLSHMWDRCAQYLRKMGGLILIASVAVWFLSYYPTPDAAAPAETMEEHYENSYLGQVGQACSPVFEPLGLNWKASIAILTGLPAKEIVVSTLGVLYSEQGDAPEAELDSPTLSQRLVASGDFTPASALAFLVFILLYLPCIATIVAIAAEIGWRWACISVLYNTALAWIMAYLTYHLFSWL
ncbi:nucleoside recognition domain-containing protein, partial [Alistipes putredinis]|uniref:nucleoside recognition domain-containing protein n=1 Tax=Alistipes putredinis TaxID=28117 RepID=UPI003AAE45A1